MGTLDVSAATPQHTCVFGLGWGDEGKGKIVDLLCPGFDVVVRFNGGANAGHTVCVGDATFALHLLPSGVLHKNATNIIGPGVVVDPAGLLSELDDLRERGVDAFGRVTISDRAHLVLAYHKIEDQLSERSASGGKLGTTARGIGPCYADKMRRTTAVRFADLLHEDGLEQRVAAIVEAKKAQFERLYGDDGGLALEPILAGLTVAKDRLGSCIRDTTAILHDALRSGRRILFEGANGMLLDVNHGTYPFVTSSSTGPHGIGPGAGVPARHVECLIGVTKAYSTRVGAGPFATELSDATGERLRQQGHEFGTTTGRPRRCGWFDAVAGRYAAEVSGVTDLALMHLDTLSGFDTVGVCTGYEIDGQPVDRPPADVSRLARVKPIIEHVPGWDQDLRAVRRFDDLPAAARAYVERIERLVGAPVSLIGVGPERSQTLVRGNLARTVHIPESTVA